ncbi:MAG TPA: DUF3348 family protein [Thauera sp.]|nr:DUF3348 family protein [Thauera sp.]
MHSGFPSVDLLQQFFYLAPVIGTARPAERLVEHVFGAVMVANPFPADPHARNAAALIVALARDRRSGALPEEVSERLLQSRYGVGRVVLAAALRQLAALDAVLDQALAAREASLLATVPVLLGKRFAQFFEAHRREREAAPDVAGQAATGGAAATGEGAPGAGASPDDPARWMQPGGWLVRFCAEMQRVLLAELDLRLMPVAGLVAALDKESTELQ